MASSITYFVPCYISSMKRGKRGTSLCDFFSPSPQSGIADIIIYHTTFLLVSARASMKQEQFDFLMAPLDSIVIAVGVSTEQIYSII